jgi:hypothetical protein
LERHAQRALFWPYERAFPKDNFVSHVFTELF